MNILEIFVGGNNREKPTVALALCEDDAIIVGENTAKVGLGGTLVTEENKKGNQSVFPDSLRGVIANSAPDILKSVDDTARSMGMKFVGGDHPGCGWDGAQDIPPTRQSEMTKKLLESVGVDYVGKMAVSNTPQPLAFPGLSAAITRQVEDHSHDGADGTLISVGGFVTQEETVEACKALKIRQPFHIAADMVAAHNEAGRDMDGLAVVLRHEINLAGLLSEDALNTIGVVDAQRLPEDHVNLNRSFVGGILGLIFGDDE